MRRVVLAALLGAAVLVQGCGSTVQQRGELAQSAVGTSDGLSGGGPLAPAAASTTQGRGPTTDVAAPLAGGPAQAGPAAQAGTGAVPGAGQAGAAGSATTNVGGGGPDIRIGYPVVDTTGVSTVAGFNNANQQAAPGQKEDK